MFFLKQRVRKVIVLGAACALFQAIVQAEPWVYAGRDLMLGFRQPDATDEMLVNLGQVSAFTGLAAGAEVVIDKFSTNQLAAAFSNWDNLKWSLFAATRSADEGPTNVPNNTLYMTRPRENPAIQTAPWVRNSIISQAGAANRVTEIGQRGTSYSNDNLADPLKNTPTVLVEQSGHDFSFGLVMGANGRLNGNFQGNIENDTGATFSSLQRSDFYELLPGTGPGRYLGYFEFRTNGTMIFKAAGGEPLPQPPVAPVLLATAVSQTRIDLQWADLTNETGFKLEQKNMDTGEWAQIASLAADTTNAPQEGLTAGTEYVYRLRAFNEAGDSPFSAEVSATTLPLVTNVPVTVQISGLARTGNRTAVSFNTTNDARVTYHLCMTNQAGLSAPLGTWPRSPATVTGNGEVRTIEDTSDSSSQFYGIFASSN